MCGSTYGASDGMTPSRSGPESSAPAVAREFDQVARAGEHALGAPRDFARRSR